MPREPFPDRRPDDPEPPGSGWRRVDESEPRSDGQASEQGLFVCLPAEELTLEGFAQNGRSDTMAPGALLATVLEAVTGEGGSGLATLADDQLIGVISAVRRMESRTAWMLLAALAELAGRRPASGDPGDRGQYGFSEFAPDEVAAELRVSVQSAAGQMIYACAVAGRLPRSFAALAAGQIHPVHLRIIDDETRILSAELAAALRGTLTAAGMLENQVADRACGRSAHGRRLVPALSMTSRTLEVLERHSEAKRLIQYQRPAVYGVRDVPAARPVEAVLLNLADPRPVLVEMDDQISRNPSGGVLETLGRGVDLDGRLRGHLDDELDVILYGVHVIGVTVAQDDVGVPDVEPAVGRRTRGVREPYRDIRADPEARSLSRTGVLQSCGQPTYHEVMQLRLRHVVDHEPIDDLDIAERVWRRGEILRGFQPRFLLGHSHAHTVMLSYLVAPLVRAGACFLTGVHAPGSVSTSRGIRGTRSQGRTLPLSAVPPWRSVARSQPDTKPVQDYRQADGERRRREWEPATSGYDQSDEHYATR